MTKFPIFSIHCSFVFSLVIFFSSYLLSFAAKRPCLCHHLKRDQVLLYLVSESYDLVLSGLVSTV